MSNRDEIVADQREPTAFIVTHVVKPGAERRYEDWTREILRAVSNFPGYLGREVVLPAHGDRRYTVIVRFDNNEHLRAWAESETRREFIRRADHLMEKGDQYEIRTGIDFWFEPKGLRPPKPWKQYLLTTSAVYPLSLIIPKLLAPLFRVAPSLSGTLISGLLIAAILTALLTFVIMPHYTRLVSKWLYEDVE
ncbi:MAG TPA: antibiotic biosynthesis monooxygenase [Blastocatellia bacterium]